jgi:transcriptional regulator with XRE-family HTH domain
MSSFPVPMNRIRPLANLLRASRLKAGLTQQQVAEAIDIHPGVYGSIERAGMMPAVPTLQRICLALKLDYQSVVA